MASEMNPDRLADLNRVVQLIATLYNSENPARQAEANKQLTDLQSSEKIWDLCWPLLDLNSCCSVEVNFFAANTLVLKINQSWNQQDQDWLENHLRPKLFETLVNHAGSSKSSKLVVERLSLALATFALHSIPTFWPDAIENILQTFTTQNLHANIPSQRVCEILLKILMYIPEEYAVLMPQQDHRAKLNGQMTQSGPVVFKFLQSLLVADSSVIAADCKRNVLKCITSWTLHSKTSLLMMDDRKSLLEILYSLIVDEDTCSSACSALGATFSNYKSDKFSNSVIEFIPKIADLKPVIDRYTSAEEIECAIKVYSLVINFSENHCKLLLNVVLGDGISLEPEVSNKLKQSIFSIIRIILDCTSTPGIYGVDEKFSDLSFCFWFTFFENFYYCSDSLNDLICETFNPLVDSLLSVMLKKSQYPPLSVYQSWNDDVQEAYRCYRQDIGDNISLIVQFPRARERILASLHDNLAQELTNLMNLTLESPWQGFEAVVFALKSVAEYVLFDEVKYIPKVFSILSQVPFNESHALLYCTVAEMIPAFSDWLYMQNTHLATAFNILFLGVNSSHSHVRLMSTLSLKDLTTECQSSLHPFASKIVESCTATLLQPNSCLSTNEKSRLMHTIGTTLAISPYESVINSMNTLTAPLIADLKSNTMQDSRSDPNCRAIILDRLSMVNSLVESLYIKPYSGNDYENDDENQPRELDISLFESSQDSGAIVQPCLSLLKQLIPILSDISTKHRCDEEIMDLISSAIKRSAKSLSVEIKPLLKEMLSIIVDAYDPLMNSNILEGCLPYYLLFKVDKSVHPLLRDAFVGISNKTLELCIKNPLKQLSVTIENFFRFSTAVCKKFPDFLTVQEAPSINVELIFKLAVASLELPEKKTLSEVCNFLSLYRQKSMGVEQLHGIFVSQLYILLENIFNVLAGTFSTPRNAIDTVTDLLFTVVEDRASSRTLLELAKRENFPTSYVSKDFRERFVHSIILERSRRKFKETCMEFVMVARNLNRLV